MTVKFTRRGLLTGSLQLIAGAAVFGAVNKLRGSVLWAPEADKILVAKESDLADLERMRLQVRLFLPGRDKIPLLHWAFDPRAPMKWRAEQPIRIQGGYLAGLTVYPEFHAGR